MPRFTALRPSVYPVIPGMKIPPLLNKYSRMYHSLRILLLCSTILTGCNYDAPGRAAAGTATCTVRSVLDGDSIVAMCDGRRRQIRLYCIDAPEKEQRPWGEESRRALQKILKRKDRISLAIHDVDSYGRQVAEVFHDGRNINLLMVQAGKAAVYRRYCALPAFYAAEASAKQARRGIWERNGLHQAPWRWRHR